MTMTATQEERAGVKRRQGKAGGAGTPNEGAGMQPVPPPSNQRSDLAPGTS